VSIIYDALQKTQKNRAAVVGAMPAEKEIPRTVEKVIPLAKYKNIEWIDVLLLVVILCLLLAVIHASHHKWKKYISQKQYAQVMLLNSQKQALQLEARAGFKKSHVLNGVFLSTNEKVALINNKSFHMGDTVDGMKLVSLELNKVKLQNSNSTLVLNVFAG